ncbi:exported hypothetical protein [metagenome]
MLRKFVLFLAISVLFSIIILQPVFAFEPDIHRAINNDALSKFMKNPIMNKINDQHDEVDKLTGEHFSPEWHFDDCMFQEGTSIINQQYILTLGNLNPKSPNYQQASVEWGKLLHPAQDFYAHSNWLESGQGKLVDGTLQTWVILSPLSSVNGLVVIEGESSNISPAFKPLTVDSYHVVTTGNGKKGLISGSAYGTDNCPDEITVGHWDGSISTNGNLPNFMLQSSPYWGTGLNKDYPGRPSHETARALAKDQTLHEWCRLVNLVDIQYGKAGVKGLLDNWTYSPEAKTSCKFQNTFWIQDDASSTSIQMPDWIKTNAKWWADGITSDKEFASSIGFLVKEKIIAVNVSTNNDGTILVNDNLQIPDWIKQNAKWWSDGAIQDSDFTSGIEYMIKEKVITFSEKKIVKSESTKISNDDLKSLYLLSKWQESTAMSLSKLNDKQEKILKEFVVKKATEKQPVSKTITSLLQQQNIDRKNIGTIHDTAKIVSNEIKQIALKQGVSTSELEKITKVTTEQPDTVPKLNANQLEQNANDAVAKLNEATRLNNELGVIAIKLSDILSSKPLAILQFNNGEMDPAGYSQFLEEYRDQLSPDEISRIENGIEEHNDTQRYFMDKWRNEEIQYRMKKALEAALKEEQSQMSIMDTIPEPTLKDLVNTGVASENNIKQDSTKIQDNKQVEILALKIDGKYYPLTQFKVRNVDHLCDSSYWAVIDFGFEKQIRSIDGHLVTKKYGDCSYGKTSKTIPVLIKVPKAQADAFMKEWVVSPYSKDSDLKKYGSQDSLQSKRNEAANKSLFFKRFLNDPTGITNGRFDPYELSVLLYNYKDLLTQNEISNIENIIQHSYGFDPYSNPFMPQDLRDFQNDLMFGQDYVNENYSITKLNELLRLHEWSMNDNTLSAIKSAIEYQTNFGLPKNSKQITVFVIDGKYYPQSQFTEMQTHPPTCDSLHYHSLTSKVYSLDGTVISDPNPSGCGFGKVGLIPITVITVTPEQISTFEKNTGVSISGSPQKSISKSHSSSTLTIGPPVKWIIAEIINGEYYPWAQFKIGYPGDSCNDRHVFSIYPKVRSLNGVYLTNPDPNHVGCGFGFASTFNEVEDYPITQAQIDSFKADMGFEP